MSANKTGAACRAKPAANRSQTSRNAASSEMSGQQLTFARFPPEIRNQIYEELLVARPPKELYRSSKNDLYPGRIEIWHAPTGGWYFIPKTSRTSSLDFSIMYAARWVADEACGIFYRWNIFEAVVTKGWRSSTRTRSELQDIASTQPPVRVELIRSLAMVINCNTVYWRLLGNIAVQFTNLKSVSIAGVDKGLRFASNHGSVEIPVVLCVLRDMWPEDGQVKLRFCEKKGVSKAAWGRRSARGAVVPVKVWAEAEKVVRDARHQDADGDDPKWSGKAWRWPKTGRLAAHKDIVAKWRRVWEV
ncbi:hypothetical protein EJ06DRAFT_529919 [Trichodelitschia bisporula]|uniref:Uncharacterized protein n=1 Tax=Trichodelitschia bisporula TaxID=703511 RepID=A0A6G1HYL0_9PEZI|nr:hypothetical protein EJ06DRAFT_529919 [Trichodelitschia bisporula]